MAHAVQFQCEVKYIQLQWRIQDFGKGGSSADATRATKIFKTTPTSRQIPAQLQALVLDQLFAFLGMYKVETIILLTQKEHSNHRIMNTQQ